MLLAISMGSVPSGFGPTRLLKLETSSSIFSSLPSNVRYCFQIRYSSGKYNQTLFSYSYFHFTVKADNINIISDHYNSLLHEIYQKPSFALMVCIDTHYWQALVLNKSHLLSNWWVIIISLPQMHLFKPV